MGISLGKGDGTYSKGEQVSQNKNMHNTNGNNEVLRDDIQVIEVNASNANFTTKIEELQVIVDKTKADIAIISKANTEVKNDIKMTERESKFTAYNIIDKVI